MRNPLLTFFLCLLLIPPVAQAQVLTAIEHKQGPYGLDVDKGSSGLWFQLKKLNTTASAMHTTAHPDDEHAGLLTRLSRGQGVRTALLTINRGEAGANATGPELFDALGLIRTEELLLSGQYYGLDDQYFTTLTDYGYSKTLEEALRSWGREAVLEDMVRIIRVNRPLVVISRFHGSNRDGHGHHQAAGGITPEAFEAAGDPNRFPEQISEEGLRPWRPIKLFQGGVREQEPHHIAFDQSMYDPLLGDSYYNFGYYGLSLQRSQTSGRSRRSLQRSILYYNQLNTERSRVDDGFFEGMDTSISGMYSLFGERAPDEIATSLASLETSIEEAITQFDIQHPTSSIPALANALKAARKLLEMDLHEEVDFLVRIKSEQIQEAINTALGIHLSALAIPEDAPVVASFWAPLPTLEGVVNGQAFNVEVEFGKGAEASVYLKSLQLEGQSGLTVNSDELDKKIELIQSEEIVDALSFMIPVDVNAEAHHDRPYFYRPSIVQNQYSTLGDAPIFLPHSPASLKAHAVYEVDGVEVHVERTVRMRRSNLPNGYKTEPLRILPRVAVNASPATRMIPVQKGGRFEVEIEVINNDDSGAEGVLSLQLPEGWRSYPDVHMVAFSSSGERDTYVFEVEAGDLAEQVYDLQVACIIDGVAYSEGYEKIERNEFETQYLYKSAIIQVRGVDVDIAEDLQVGYIMGVGDEVPSGIEQLGATVELLDEQDLARAELSSYDVIIVGTRGYAVRDDLLNYNNRLMNYAKDGGHLIVLYQTPEYQPEQMAPYTASLPRNAEEVSEQDSPVTILEPDNPVFHAPNTITENDFEGWVEQRGSKFFSTWDSQYTPLVEMQDTGQPPQRGAWLTTSVGEGRFTYFAIAIHRQTPFAVPGPYRIFANLLSLGQ